MRLAAPPVAEAARELGLQVLQTANVNEAEALSRIRAARPSAGVVCAFGQLIRKPLLDELRWLNVHPSLLPRWRGAAPIERAIMAGDLETGVSVMRLTEGLDSGPVALQERVPIEPGDDYGSLSERLARLGGDLLVRALELEAVGQLSFEPQDDSRATYAPKIEPVERRLDPSLPASELEARVRALTPHVGAYFELGGGQRLGVRRASAEPGDMPAGDVSASGGELRIGCSAGVLRLCVVQPPGARPMATEAYLRGHVPPSRVEVPSRPSAR